MIETRQISKTYQTKRGAVHALREVDFSIDTGEFVIVRGPSGSGKTTLLFALGGMLRPSEGVVNINGADLYRMNQSQRAAFRAKHIGFVFQMFHLVGYLNVLENVMLPLGLHSNGIGERDAVALLERLGLAERMTHRPSELSAGERQRVAIARAFLRKPDVILADEPTGNLDPDNASLILQALSEYAKDGGSVALVTHGHLGDDYADRTVFIREGRLTYE